MIEPLLKSQLEPVARRHRQFQLWRGLAMAWAGAAAAGWLALILQRALGGSFPLAIPLVLSLAALVAWIGLKRSRRWNPDYRRMARDIEQQHPKLHALLLTAVEQQADPQTGQLNFLQERVVTEAVRECKKYQWLDTVSTRQLFWMQAGHLAALAALVAVLLALRSTPTVPPQAVAAVANGVKVTPGDTEVEKGNGLVVLAQFEGRVPAEATLVMTTAAVTARRRGSSSRPKASPTGGHSWRIQASSGRAAVRRRRSGRRVRSTLRVALSVTQPLSGLPPLSARASRSGG